MDVLGIDVVVLQGDEPGAPIRLELRGFVTQTDGVYVEVNLQEAIEQFAKGEAKTGAVLLAHDLDLALKTMADIYDNPDRYVQSGTITELHAKSIKLLRMEVGRPTS